MSRPPRALYTGFFAESSGYGVAARRHALALAAAGVPLSVRPVHMTNGGGVDATIDPAAHPELAALVGRRGAPRVAIVHTPPDLYPHFRERGLPHIGVSAWETERLPPSWRGHADGMDEIWACSGFVAGAFRHDTSRPVVVVPHPVYPIRPGPRALPGIPDGVFLFVAIFEWQDRKNPDGLLRAFRRAFAGRDDVGLLVKTGLRIGADRARVVDQARRLAGGPWVRRTPPVWLAIEPELSDAALHQLYRRADACVSLHHAEGFGLTMAEAMAAGRPVVATGWSGNLEFMDDESAFLVEHRLVPARQPLTPHPLFEGMRWAEPVEEAAVSALRRCAFDHAARARIAAAGQRRVREQLAPSRIGALMRDRLIAVAGSTTAGAAARR
jgi:glycosyltransferase involved in cell wall biosynthesis